MITLDLATLVTATDGQLLCHVSLSTITIDNLVTDSRALTLKEKLQEKFRLWVNLNILNVKDISYNKIKLFLMDCNGLQWIIFVKLEINFGKIDIFIH